MFGKVEKAVALLEEAVGELDPEVLEPKFAVGLMNEFAKVVKLGEAGKTLAAKRVESSGTWRTEGDRSPAHFIARKTGDTVSSSVTTIETAKRLEDLPSTDQAFRSGKLNLEQTAEIASAASVAPKQEKTLIALAQTEGTEKLRQECRTVLAQHCNDQAEKAERLHRSRYLRTWTDQEGAFRLDAKLTPEAGAEVRSVLDVIGQDLFEQARGHGRKEPTQAIEADALLEMARAARTGSSGKKIAPKAVVNLTVDIKALNRGHLEEGELCEISGIGPISIPAARTLMTDSFLKVLFVKNGNILEVAHIGRYITAAMETALKQRYPECVIERCRETKGLEIDHVNSLKKFGLTELGNLIRLCPHHHYLKTHGGYLLKETRGKWKLVPPKKTRAGPY